MSSDVRSLTNKPAAEFCHAKDKDIGVSSLSITATVGSLFLWAFWDTVMLPSSFLKHDIVRNTWIQFNPPFYRVPLWLQCMCSKKGNNSNGFSFQDLNYYTFICSIFSPLFQIPCSIFTLFHSSFWSVGSMLRTATVLHDWVCNCALFEFFFLKERYKSW